MSDFAPWLANPTYEVFPAAGIEASVAEHLPAGSRVAITHSPRHGVARSAEIACALAAEGYEPVLHVAAKGTPSQALLEEVAGRARAAGVEEAFVVGGDGEAPSGPFANASELLAAIVALPDPFPRIGVGGHPEGHPHASEDDLLAALLEKQRLGASYVATQMCFDADAWRAWAARIEAAGVTLPLSVGVPGVVSRRKLLEIGIKAGAGPSLRALKGQKGFALRALGGGAYAPVELLSALAADPDEQTRRIESLHLFTFNSLDATVAWVQRAQASSGVQI
ncbi:MAG TPA: methylenetetrahydrofolate reductase [Conexibacter sp.]|nr:methylenetetrahydrofolate reductase [Conexibacter sp.]